MWNFLASSALSCRSPCVVLLSMLERNSCSLSPIWLSRWSFSVALFFCASTEVTFSLSSSRSLSSWLFSFCVSASCFWSLLRLYSCSCSRRFSSSSFSASSLDSLCWYTVVVCSSLSTCLVSASFSSLSRWRWVEFARSLSARALFSCENLSSSHRTCFVSASFSFSISVMRVISLLVMASSSASSSDSRLPIRLLISSICSSAAILLFFSAST
mmetsp:Transcript_28517/g.72182  ORF Transcript_28517/g.72182 Transcript_28517/m.72182 type:complete len:214 (+) Transcript_28517:765-1406(+)